MTSNPGNQESDPLSKGLGRRWRFGKDISSWPMLKVAHANQRKAELESRVSLWHAGSPFETEANLSADRLKWEMRLRVNSLPPTQEWSLILGDLLYSLRSSLDACVWEFAHIDGNIPAKPTQLQFPVVRDRKDWEKARATRLQTVPKEVIERIEMAQPFNRPEEEIDRDPLMILTELNNLDKHRASIELSIEPDSINQNFSAKWGTEEEADRNAPPSITYHFPKPTDGALLVDASFLDPVEEVRGGFAIGMNMKVQTGIGPQNLILLSSGLINSVNDLLNFIAHGPATPQELKEIEERSTGEWRDMDMLPDESGRTVHTRPHL
ncbi:hypothetical protein ACWCPT_06875 [Streptomyces sp. NPDC002308]